MTTPFDNVNFGSEEQLPSITNDDVVRVLKGFNPDPLQQPKIDTSGGVERVNKNSANTGVVAYRDSKGQAVLTNVARDSSGQEKPIAALLRAPEQASPTFVQGGTGVRLQLHEGLRKLAITSNIEEARAIYSSITESLAAEQARLETEAYQFAENKFGIPETLKQVEQNRQLDRSSADYLPGMGDSPITQKIVEQARLLSVTAKQDADSYLKRNMTYNSLKTLAANAEREYRRVETNSDRLAQLTLSKQMTADNAEKQALVQQRARREDREERRIEEAQKIYNSLSSTQIARITMLNAAEIEGIDNDNDRRVKIADLALNGKDKKFREAVMAESPQDLLGMALQGNGIAKKLVVLEEAQKTGRSIEEVEAMIKGLTLRLADPKMASEVLGRNRTLNKNDKEARMAALNGAMFAADPNKKLAASQERIALLMEDAQFKINQQFIGDVSTWGSADPALLAAIDRAKKVTGKADIKSVAASYIGDATDVERKFRLNDFQRAIKNAALKQKDSIFGMPNWREAEKLVVNTVVEKGFFTKLKDTVQDAGFNPAYGPMMIPAGVLTAANKFARGEQ